MSLLLNEKSKHLIKKTQYIFQPIELLSGKAYINFWAT